MKIQQFVEELQRRHVFRVAGAYFVASWVSIEVTKTVLEILRKDQSQAKWVLYAAIIGIPIMLLLSWMFDFTKDGIVRTPALGSTPGSPEPATGAAMTGVSPAAGGRIVLSPRATGMFGLGAIVAIVSLAAYTRVHTIAGPEAQIAADSTTLVNIAAIAVMPFQDMSEKHDQEYFADGMTEELLARLAQIENLQIVSGQGFAGANRGGDLQTVAERLNVQAVLEGNVRKSQDSIRVSVKLINPATNAVLYVQSFTRPISNVFQVQDEIAAAVAGSLQVQLHTGVTQATGSRGTKDPEAQEFYMQGLNRMDERTDADLRQAVVLFNRALEEDPKFPDAWAALAETYAVLPTVGNFDFEEAGTKGNEAAANAISFAPTLGQAYAALGQIAQNLRWNPAAAENSYKQAIEFSRNNPTAHQWYAETLTMLGRTDEALAEIGKALELKPHSPAAKNTLGYLLTVRGDLDSALVVFRNEAELYPEYRLGHLTHALTALTAKKYDEAETAAKAYAGRDTKLAAAFTAVIRASAGTAPRPDGIRAAASLEPKLGAGFTALWYAALDDRANAMRLVKKAFATGKDANFPYFVIHPLLRTLHDEPGYKLIVNEMGVVPAK